MIIYPLIVAVVSLAFAVIVGAQWLSRRRPQQLVWSVALLMAFVASASFVIFQANGSEFMFRLYYVFGALMMAAYLGMGSLYLAFSRRVANLVLAVLVIVSAIGVALILVAPLHEAVLHKTQHVGGAGTGVLKTGLWLVPVIVLNIFGAAAVIVVALYSAYKVVQREAPARFAVANITIAVGTGVISAAGTLARLGSPNTFWLVMAVGWVIIFAGFLLTTNLAAVGAASGRDITMGHGTAAV